MKTKKSKIQRREFENSGWRIITLAHGEVCWPDGRNNRFNVRLQAQPGTAGEIVLIVEDINKDSSFAKAIPLSRKP